MRVAMEIRWQLAARFEALLPYLNERQRRLLLATEARLLGHGGVRAVAQVAGVSETTIRKGLLELDPDQGPLPLGRARRPGGGRKRAEDNDPGLVPALLGLVEPDERGDPMSPLRWTTKSLRHLATELARQGHAVSASTVGRLLREQGFSLQGTAKTLEGAQHPDRDAQFRYLYEQVKAQQADGEPVISVDAKKKEMLGQLPNAGREWRPKGDPIRVEDHSFFTAPHGEQAIPYGVYDRIGRQQATSLNLHKPSAPSTAAKGSRAPWRSPAAGPRGRQRRTAARPQGRGRASRAERPARTPPGLGLPNVQADDLTAAALMDPVGDHQRLVAHPTRLADPLHLGVQPQVRVAALKRVLPEHPHLLIQAAAQPRHLVLGHAGDAELLHQPVHPPGRDAVDVGLLHHRDQRLLGPPAWLQEAWEVAAGPQPEMRSSSSPTRVSHARGR
jgi:transposase